MAKKSLSDQKVYSYVLVDTMNLLARSFHGMKDLEYKGVRTGMIYGVARLLLSYRYVDRIFFIWEGGDSWRRALYPFYKARRHYDRSDRTEFSESVNRVKALLPQMGIDQVWADTMEADDVVPYLVKWSIVEHGARTLLVSTDEDWYAYLSTDIDILYRNVTKTAAIVERELGFPPHKINLYKILTGCKTDEIPGIPRFPTKLAARLAKTCDTWQDAIETMNLSGNQQWAKRARQYQWLLQRNEELVLPAKIDREQVHFVDGEYDQARLCKSLLDYGMVRIVEKLGG